MKYRSGYEQGKLEGAWVGNQLKDADKIRRELNKLLIPQFVADVIEGAREQSVELEDAFEYVWEVAPESYANGLENLKIEIISLVHGWTATRSRKRRDMK